MNEALPEDLTGSDVWQWLGRGWFYHLEPGQGRVPAQLQEHDSREGRYTVSLTNGDTKEFKREECYPYWPQCGAINMQGFAIVIDRQSQRQYRRTYNDRCVLLNVPRKWDVMKKYESAKLITPNSPEVVSAVFDPVYYTYTRALGLLEQGWVSVALNPFLIVAGTVEEQLIYYRSKLTARIEGGKLMPLDPENKRNRRILKWFDGRIAHDDPRSCR